MQEEKAELPVSQNGINPSSKTPSLKRNYIYSFLSQLLALIIPLATTPYLSRVLHEEGNGQISFAASIITIFLIFAYFGFDTYGQREIAKFRNNIEEKSKTFWELVILRAISTTISAIVLYAVLFSTGFTKANDLILLYSIQLVGNVFDIQFFFRGEEDFKSVAIRTIFLKLAGLVCVFVFVKTANDTGTYVLCISISTVVSNMVLWPSLKKKIKTVPLKSLSFRKHLFPSLAIFVPALAETVYAIMDKAEIGWFAQNSDYENGCYEQAFKINSIALILVTVISPILAPRNAFDYQNGNQKSLEYHLAFSFKYIWLVGTPLIVGFSVMSYSLSSWFLGPGYAEVPLLMQIMSVRFIASGIGENVGNDLFIPIGKEKYTTIATCLGATINVISNIFFIRLWGAVGAAITTAITEIIVTGVLMWLAFKDHFVTWKMAFSGSWKCLLASGAMFVVIFFMNRYLAYNVFTFILIVIAGSLTYFLGLLLLRNDLLLLFLRKAFSWLKKRTKTKQ